MPGEGRGAEGPHSPARAPAGGPGARRGRRGAAVPLRSWPPSRGARAPHRASSAPGPRASIRGPRRRLVRALLGLGFRLGGQWEGALRPPPASTAHADPPPGGGARCALTVGASARVRAWAPGAPATGTSTRVQWGSLTRRGRAGAPARGGAGRSQGRGWGADRDRDRAASFWAQGWGSAPTWGRAPEHRPGGGRGLSGWARGRERLDARLPRARVERPTPSWEPPPRPFPRLSDGGAPLGPPRLCADPVPLPFRPLETDASPAPSRVTPQLTRDPGDCPAKESTRKPPFFFPRTRPKAR